MCWQGGGVLFYSPPSMLAEVPDRCAPQVAQGAGGEEGRLMRKAALSSQPGAAFSRLRGVPFTLPLQALFGVCKPPCAAFTWDPQMSFG